MLTFSMGVFVGVFGMIALRLGAGFAAERCHQRNERRRDAVARRQLSAIGQEFESYELAKRARGKEWTN